MVSMVSSAVLGAAAGTGLALVVAVTIVVYRYYAFKRKGKYWSNLDRWPDPPTANKNNEKTSDIHQHSCHDNSAATSYVLDCWKKPQQSYYAVQKTVKSQDLSNKNQNCSKLKNTGDRYLDQSIDILQIFIKIDERKIRYRTYRSGTRNRRHGEYIESGIWIDTAALYD
ncbi:hypothetical protein HZH66_011273 [Vespula vulgaris]|uniref:Uncharacterized protein n=1 Tax=Vespula vulgaris TaxID=7454 RepID=A0A834JJY7_VESVU|nr:hypothetical protein HZH66_011273 [Vespula vulgaris]